MNDHSVDQSPEDLQQDLAAGKVLEWAEVYALDAVSVEERTMIDQHISAAPEELRGQFEERVRQARETIAAVYATDEVNPPQDLLRRILDRLPAPAALEGRDDDGDHATTSGRAAGAADRPAGPGDELAMRRARKSPASAARNWIIGAAAAAVLAVGAVAVTQNLAQPSVQEQVIQAADVAQDILQIPAGGTAEVWRSDSVNAAVVTLHGVPSPEEGKVYQMWRLPADGSPPESVGIMSRDDLADGQTTVLENIEPYSAVAITVEPAGGSETPTMPIVAQIPLDA